MRTMQMDGIIRSRGEALASLKASLR